MEDFCGVEILTYCITSNHIHILVRVPEATALSDTELLRRFALLYSKEKGRVSAFEALLKSGDKKEADKERKKTPGAYG